MAVAASPRAIFTSPPGGERAMLLAINANNTNTKVALYDGDRPAGLWRIRTEPGRTADEYIAWLDHLMALKGLVTRDVDASIIATVVPPALLEIQNWPLRQIARSVFPSPS